MGRKVVVELKCDRCGRTEHSAPDGRTDNEPVFECIYKGKKLTFNDLCSGCVEVVATHVADIVREMKKVSPIRKNETRNKAVEKLTSSKTTPPPIPQKSPGLGEKNAAPHGPSQRS